MAKVTDITELSNEVLKKKFVVQANKTVILHIADVDIYRKDGHVHEDVPIVRFVAVFQDKSRNNEAQRITVLFDLEIIKVIPGLFAKFGGPPYLWEKLYMEVNGIEGNPITLKNANEWPDWSISRQKAEYEPNYWHGNEEAGTTYVSQQSSDTLNISNATRMLKALFPANEFEFEEI